MPTSVNRRFYADQSSVMSTYVNFITNLLPGRATSGKTRHGLRTIRASSTCHVSYYRCSSRLMWIFGTSFDVNRWTVSQQEVLLQVAVRTCECVCDACVYVYAGIISKKDLPGYHHLQVLHSLENIATTVTTVTTIATMSMPRLRARSPCTARWKVVTSANKPHGPSCTELKTVKKVISINQFQRETDISPKISKTWNLHSIIFNPSTLDI